jgi:8-oxo-dGTP pyrophosphatase MutT (NUDIX family)
MVRLRKRDPGATIRVEPPPPAIRVESLRRRQPSPGAGAAVQSSAVPTPDFVLTLREKIGHDLLPLVGVCAVVLDDEDRLLLTRRQDTGRWALIGGIVEPGEQPAAAAVREVLEETGIVAVIERLVAVIADPPTQYPNGDQVQFLTFTFLLRQIGGHAAVSDDENLEVSWFHANARPELERLNEIRLAHALAEPPPTHYEL